MSGYFPPDFFTAPADASLSAGIYAVVARRPFMADPFTLATLFFCRGDDRCKWTESYYEMMNIKIAIDPGEPEDRRNISRDLVKKLKSIEDDPNFIGPVHPGCLRPHVLQNVVHFEAVRGAGNEQKKVTEHALVIDRKSVV